MEGEFELFDITYRYRNTKGEICSRTTIFVLDLQTLIDYR